MLENIKNFHRKTSSINPRIGLQIYKPISFPSSKPIYFWLAVKSPPFFNFICGLLEKKPNFSSNPQSSPFPPIQITKIPSAVCSIYFFHVVAFDWRRTKFADLSPSDSISYHIFPKIAPHPNQPSAYSGPSASGPDLSIVPSMLNSVRWKFRTEPISLSLAEALTCLSSMLASIRSLRIHIFFVREDRSWAATKGSRSLWVHPLQFLLRNPNFIFIIVFTVSAPLLAVHHVWAWRLRF